MREDNKWFTYKTSVELLKLGLFVGALVMNDDDYASLLTNKHAVAIKKIKLEIDGNYFSDDGLVEAYFVNYPQNTLLK